MKTELRQKRTDYYAKLKEGIRRIAIKKLLFTEVRPNKKAEFLQNKHTLFSRDFVYKDENWEEIRNFTHRANLNGCRENVNHNDYPCVFEDKGFIRSNVINIQSKCIENNWIFFQYDKDLPGKYEFSFDLLIDSAFSEIQIAFKYYDLKNRLRFMIRDNKKAVFEMVYNGQFYKNLFEKPLSLQMGTFHNFKIVVNGNQFELFVDRNLIFSVHQNINLTKLGKKLCFILYNKDANGSIACSIKDECGI